MTDGEHQHYSVMVCYTCIQPLNHIQQPADERGPQAMDRLDADLEPRQFLLEIGQDHP